MSIAKSCNNCRYFTQHYLHEKIDGERKLIHTGDCSQLLEMLKLENGKMTFMERLVVLANFSCAMWKA